MISRMRAIVRSTQVFGSCHLDRHDERSTGRMMDLVSEVGVLRIQGTTTPTHSSSPASLTGFAGLKRNIEILRDHGNPDPDIFLV